MPIVLAGTAVLTGALTEDVIDNSGSGFGIIHATTAAGYSDTSDATHIQLAGFDDFGGALNADGTCYVYGSLSLPSIIYPINRIEFKIRAKGAITVTQGVRLGHVHVKAYHDGNEIGLLDVSDVTGYNDFSIVSTNNPATGLAWTISDLGSASIGFVTQCLSIDNQYGTTVEAFVAEYGVDVYVSQPDTADKLTTNKVEVDSTITLRTSRTGINARRVVSDPLIER